MGELFAVLKIDDSDFNRGLDQAGTKMGSTSAKATSLGGVLQGAVKVGALAGAAAIVGFGVSSISAAANFEHAVDQIGAVANATEQEMKGLSDAGLRIGKDTAFGATEAASAMEILAANGVSAEDILNGAADAAVNLAAAGGTDLKTAADVASTAMSVWGIKTTEMTDVVNRLAGAANVSRFGVEDMAQAVAQGGGAAKTAGVEFGDFTTAIAAIAPSFSSGSDAGTSFKTFLVGLTGSSDKAKDAMKDLGLITADGANQFFDATGKMKSMAEVTDLLHNATVNLSEQQKIEAFQTIFGTDAMRAASAMAGLTGAEFKKMDDTMKNTDASVVAKQRMDNFKGSMDQLKGSIETLQIQIGSKLIPVLTAVALALASGIPAAADAAGPALELVGSGMEIIYNISKPLLELLAAHPEIIMAMVGAWAAWQALQLASSFLTMLTSINQWTIGVGIARAEAMAFKLAAAGMMTGAVLAGMMLAPPVIDGIKQAFFGANEEAENFAGGLEDVQGRAELLSGVGLLNLKRDLKALGDQVDTEKGRVFEYDQKIAGMVQGLVAGGASIETVMSVIKAAGVDNIPAVTKVVDELHAGIEAARLDVLHLSPTAEQEFARFRTAAETVLPGVAVAMRGTQADFATAVDDLVTSIQTGMADGTIAVQDFTFDLDMSVDEWIASMAKAQEPYDNYQTNLKIVLDAIAVTHAEHFKLLGEQVLTMTPQQVANWASAATQSSTKFAEGMDKIITENEFVIGDLQTDTIAGQLPLYQQWLLMGQGALDGFIDGIEAKRQAVVDKVAAVIAMITGKAQGDLEESSPSMVFHRMGSGVAQGFAEGIAEGTIIVQGAADGMVEVILTTTAAQLDAADALQMLEMGYEDAADAILDYVAGLGSLGAAMDALPVSQFDDAIEGILEHRQDIEEMGQAGATMMDTLNKAITEGSPAVLEHLAQMALDMQDKMEEGLSPEQAAFFGDQMMEAIREAIETGGAEGVKEMEDILTQINDALGDGTGEALSLVDQFKEDLQEEFGDRALEEEIGRDGFRLMEALNDALESGGEKGLGTLTTLTADMMDALGELDVPGAATLGVRLMAALQTALTTGGADAIAALAAILAQINDMVDQVDAPGGGTSGGGGGPTPDPNAYAGGMYTKFPGYGSPSVPWGTKTLTQALGAVFGPEGGQSDVGGKIRYLLSSYGATGNTLSAIISKLNWLNTNVLGKGQEIISAFGSLGTTGVDFRTMLRANGLAFQRGTWRVPGPIGAGDIVPAMLSPGEAVLDSRTAEMVRRGLSGGSSRPFVQNNHTTINGVLPGDVQREVERANRKLAVEWGLR